MTNKHTYLRYLYIFVVLLLLVSAFLSGQATLSVYAYTSSYTSVLTDLQVDSEFVSSDYPYVADDYSINIIQIAESSEGKLFVYTYQPCQTSKYFVATDINMSLLDIEDTDYNYGLTSSTKLYSLSLLSCESVFCKYLVKDFTVSEHTTRYYNITSIYRDWDKDIDKGTGNDNVKNSVAYAVGTVFRAKTENGIVSYSS